MKSTTPARQNRTARAYVATALAVFSAALAVGGILTRTALALSSQAANAASVQSKSIGKTVEASPLKPADVDEQNWMFVQKPGPGFSLWQRGILERYRNAGAWFTYTPEGTFQHKAILHDNHIQSDRIIQEGEILHEDIRVLRILRDRIIIVDAGGQEVELWQDFKSGSEDASKGDTQSRSDLSDFDSRALEKFGGRKTGDNRYLFSRDALIEYYKTLYDNPDRLVLVFDSMKPVYNEEDKIEGYQLQVEGEQEFFAAAGLRENDIVRSVNEVKMSNRRRAEFFIKQFARGRASAFILDVERNGEPMRLTYQVK